MQSRLVGGRAALRSSVVVIALLASAGLGMAAAYAGDQQLWARQFTVPDAARTVGWAVAADAANGQVYGLVRGGDGTDSVMETVAYTSSGTQLWNVPTGVPGDVPAAVAVDESTHTVLVAGSRGDDQLVQAYSAGGTKLWSKVLGSTSGRTVTTNAMTVDGHGRVFVTGASTATMPDYLTVAYQVSTGAVLWHERYDGPRHGGDVAVAVAADPGKGRVYVTGSSKGSHVTEMTTVAYAAATGARKWVARDTGSEDDPVGIAVDPTTHDVYAVTGTEDAGFTTQLVAYSSAGVMLWHATYGAAGDVFPSGISLDPGNGQIYVAGSEDMPTGSSIFVAAFRTDGTRPWVDVDQADMAELAVATTVDTANHRVYATGRRSTASGRVQFATFADSATGTRRWTETRIGPAPNRSGAPAGIAADSSRGQVYVVGTESTTDSSFAAETLAYHA